MDFATYKSRTRQALGEQKAELVLKNANVVNVFTDKIIKADIAICGETVVGVGKYSGEEEVDMTGLTVCPGLIDAHLHFESTLVQPQELVANAVAYGTTSFVADPHESANVAGIDGIEYILEQTEHVPANVFVMMPSCVPATPFEDNGCVLDAWQMKKLITHPRMLGLGEVMDYRSVIGSDREMFEKLQMYCDRPIDGHAPFLTDKEMSAYALAGICTDHECVSYEYAIRQRSMGLHVHIREGSAAKNLEAIVRGIVEHKTDCSGFSFCTDDKQIDEIRREGDISFCIKKAVGLGLDPITALKMGTLYTAKCYGLHHLGAIAPGYQADFVVVDDIPSMAVRQVWHKGRLVSENCKPAICPRNIPCNPRMRQTMHMQNISKESFTLRVNGDEQDILELIPGQILTRHLRKKVQTRNGFFVPDSVFSKGAVIERHHNTGKVGVGIFGGFHIQNGAIASSVSHDSHNIVVIGDNDEDMICAVKALEQAQGGYVIASEGKVKKILPLPVMGLMSDAGYESVQKTLHEMICMAHEMGVPEQMDPFITLSFAALPVIPEIRLTARGLYDVTEGRFLGNL